MPERYLQIKNIYILLLNNIYFIIYYIILLNLKIYIARHEEIGGYNRTIP